jgi:predicted ABC-type ATPase
LKELDELILNQTSFALESTLSGKAHAAMLSRAKKSGFHVVIHFLWLPSPRESIARVRLRVKKGGHHVPSEDIRRRHPKILENLTRLYLPIADDWFFWNAQNTPLRLLATSSTHAISDVQRYFEQ